MKFIILAAVMAVAAAEADPAWLYQTYNTHAIPTAFSAYNYHIPATVYNMPQAVKYEVPEKVEAEETEEKKVIAYNTLPLTYTHHQVPVTYTHNMPYVYTPYYTPVVIPQAVKVAEKTMADDRSKAENYAAKGVYHAENAGAVHIAKREAEADPALFYRSLYNYGLPSVYSTRYTTPYYRNFAAVRSPVYNTYANYAYSPYYF